MESQTIVLYHYCSMQSFYSIICNKNIRLSDSRCTNDYLENTWIVKTINDVLTSRFKEDYPQNVKQLLPYIEHIKFGFKPYIACFSEARDLLSQWRAYADDGNGVAIGFKFSIPQGVPFFYSGADVIGKSLSIEKVIYNDEDQKKLINETVTQCVEDSEKNIFCYGNRLGLLSFVYKNPAFYEEREWRIINAVIIDANNILGGAISPLHYRVTNNSMISYLEFPIDKEHGLCEIEEVVLGPKNYTIADTLHSFLEMNGFHKVKIDRSKTTYR